MLRVLTSVASFALLATAQTEERVVAVRSLQPFLQPTVQAAAGMHAAIPTDRASRNQDATMRGQLRTGTDWLAELLRQRHKTAIEAQQLMLSFDDNIRIALHGTKGAVNACLADIDAIAFTLTRSIEISVYQLPVIDGELPPAFIDGKALQAAIAATPPVWSARAVTRPGGSVQLGDVRWTAYVRDQDAEVAQETNILDPKVDNLFEGTRVSLTVHALPSDELLLHGSWLTSDRMQLLEAGIGKGRATVELPFHRTAHVTFGGRVTNGSGLCVAARREGTQDTKGTKFLFAVRARYLTPPPPRTNNLFVFPATAWTTTTTNSGWPMRAAWFVGVDGDDRHPLFEDAPIMSPHDLSAFLTPDGSGTALMAGSTLVISDNAAICARAEAALQQLVDAQLHQAELRVDQFSERGAIATSVVQPMLSNMQARAFIGTERAAIGDHEVEIAEDSSISNPVVFTARSGVWSRLTGHMMARTWNVEGLWRTAEQSPLREHQQIGKPTMTMQLPDYRTSTWSWDGPIPSNEEQLLSPGFRVQVKTQ